MFKRALDLFTPSKSLSLEEFENLYLEHKEFVRNSIFWMVGNENANELTQDTFIKAWKNYSSFKGDSTFKTWIYRIAMNTAKDFLRKHTYAVEFSECDGGPNEMEIDQKQLVEMAIAKLSVAQREMFILFYKFEYSYREISDITQVKEGTVKSRIQKAKVIFSTFVKDNGE